MKSTYRAVSVVCLLALSLVSESAGAAAAATNREGWRWGPRLDLGLSLKSASSEPNIAGSGGHLGLDLQLLRYWRSWVGDLSAGGIYNYFKGSTATQSVSVTTFAFSLEGAARYRFGGGWQIGPALRLLAGEDVSFAEDDTVAIYGKDPLSLLGGVALQKELRFADLDWRAGAQFYTDLATSRRQIYWIGVQLALELPFTSAPAAAQPATVPITRSHVDPNKKMPVMQTRGTRTVYLSFDDTILEFETDRSDLQPQARRILSSVANFLMTHPTRWQDARIEGHADYRGSTAHNQSLSFDRAKSVAMELQNLGIDPAKLSVKGFGSTRPIYHGSEIAQLVRNRRVEVYVEVNTDAQVFLDEFRTHLENRPN